MIMRTLSDYKEDLKAMYVLHKCRVTTQMDAEWQQEMVALSKSEVNEEVTLTMLSLTTGKVAFRNSLHEKWLLHPTIDMVEPGDFDHLSDLNPKVEGILFLQRILAGYDLLMSLPPACRKNWSMKFHVNLRGANGSFKCYVIGIKVYKFDALNVPWLIQLKTVRLSATYVSNELPYLEFSHPLPRKIGKMYGVIIAKVKRLNDWEKQVLQLGHEGYSVEKTARMLNPKSPNSKRIKRTREQIFAKTNTHTIAQAYLYIWKHDLVG